MAVRLFDPPTESLWPSLTGTANAAPSALLSPLMAAAGLALLEAWEDPLEVNWIVTGRDADWGFVPAQIAPGAHWEDNIYPGDRDRLRIFLETPGTSASPRSVDYRLIVGEGELLWVRHWILGRLREPGQRPRQSSALMLIPEQKRLEWECLRVSERERNRIGQELHDDLCQVLAGVGFMMQVVERRARKTDPLLAAEIDDLSTQLFQATDRARSMAHGLFPARLQFSSVREAFAALATEAKILFRIEVALDVPSDVPAHRAEQVIQLYRVVQEAIGNAVRHGQASLVQISLCRQGRSMTLRIVDNGSGFASEPSRPEGIGMHVMQYRAHRLGGTLAFESVVPNGVAAQLTYPVGDTYPPFPSVQLPS